MEEDLIIEIWDVFKEYISDKNKDTAANHFVDFLLGKDVETDVLKSLVGYDSSLDEAIALVIDEGEIDDYEDDDGYYEEED
jgi:membrane protease subunit (stomatin/prohibitin family)